MKIKPKKSSHCDISTSHQLIVHHQDGNFSVGRPLDLLPHHRIHLHDLIRQPVVVQKRPHLAAEGTGFVLVEGQLRTSF